MKTNTNTQLTGLIVGFVCLSSALVAQSETIANWKEMNPALAGTNSGMDTNSPTIGNGTANNADDAWVAGRFGTVASPESVTLAVGQTLTVSGSVTFTGGTNLGSQFRFGVFDGGAAFAADTTTWTNGGWLYVAPGTGTVGMLQAATNGTFVTNNTTTSNAVLLTSTTTNTGTFNGNSTTAYNWSFTITRDSATTVDLAASLTGGPSPVNFASSVNNRTTSLFTYSTVGLLFGGGLDLDQGALSNVHYTVVPPGGGNSAPVFAAAPITGANATEDSPYTGTLAGTATDADDDPITYAKVNGPAWLTVAGDGTLGGTPTNADVGVKSFTISATDGIAPATQAALNITVINTNDAPAFAVELIYGNNGRVGVAYAGTLAGTASDDDGDALTYAMVSGPGWLNVAGNGVLTGTPQIDDLGSNDFTVSVTDGTAPAVEAVLRILVTDTNATPVFTVDPIMGANATQGVVYSGTIGGSATDGDGDLLIYAKVNGPAWLSVAGDGGLSGTPGPGDVGANAFTVSVTDGIIASPIQATLNITVDPFTLPPGTPLQIAPDGTWTWFNDERAIWHLGKLYSGYVKRNGKVGISRFDPATLATTHTELSGFTQVDDHNNPSITVLPDNRLMVVYSQHNGSAFRRISTVTEPASISDWGSEIPTNGTSYANTYRLSGESDRIYHFNRSINWNPTLHISNDNGATFGPQIHFIATGSGSTRPYPKYVSNGTDRIDLIYTDGHPRNENNSIYHLFYQGGNFMQTDGTVVKAIGNLPILHASGERGTEVYTYSAAAWGPGDGPDDWIPGARGWTWDICYGADGRPVCAFQVQLDNVTGTGYQHDRIYYYYARWTGTGWQRRFIAHGGRGLYSSEDDYGGGMAIDPDNPNIVYISTNAANPFNLGDLAAVPLAAAERYEIWQGTTADGGLTFSWQPVTVGSASNNLRPIVPENHGYERSVVWFRGNYVSYTNFNTEVVGIFQNQLRLRDHEIAPAGGFLRWASSPGRTYRIMGSGDLQGFPYEAAVGIDSKGAETSASFATPPPLQGAPRAFFRVEEQ